MSGGYFDYGQSAILEIAEQLKQAIRYNDSTDKDEFGNNIGYHFPQPIVNELTMAEYSLRASYAYTQRIDYLLSGDDGEDFFLTRLAEDLRGLRKKTSVG